MGTLTNPIELVLQRRATERFIAADPTTVVFLKDAEQWIDGSKKIVPGTAKNPQQFKVIWTDESGIKRRESADGGARAFDCVFVGKHDADIEIGCYATVNGQKVIIEYIFPENGWEVKAGGISHGSKPT